MFFIFIRLTLTKRDNKKKFIKENNFIFTILFILIKYNKDMDFFSKIIKYIWSWFNDTTEKTSEVPVILSEVKIVTKTIFSEHLDRDVTVQLYLPPDFESTNTDYPVLFIHDGQDLERMKFQDQLETAYQEAFLNFHLVAGIVAGDRLQEYGTGVIEDYAGRGNRSAQHNQFLLKELLPLLQRDYRASQGDFKHSVAGFSLGGLAAVYLAWEHAVYFRCVGVFSGSLWWRSMAFNDQYPDANLIMHRLIDTSTKRPNLKLWFQAGTNDETSDRNGNGVIDAIDDTLFLIKILKNLGYTDDEVTYLEIANGRHEPATWAKAMPDFLRWVGGNKKED